MKVTNLTRDTLRYRKTIRTLIAEGFEEIGERGGELWQLHRGYRQDHVITNVRIGPNGKSVFVKIRQRESKMRVEVDTHFGKIKVWDSRQMEWRDPKSEEVVPALTELVVELYLKLHRLSGQ